MTFKKSRVVVIVLALAFVVALLWWWRVRVGLFAGSKPVFSQVTGIAPPINVRGAANSPSANGPAGSQIPSPPPTQKPSPELRRTFETLNHNDIEFYGRAVDQFGEPVPAAEVRAVVIVNTGTHGGEMHRQTTTDAQGYFQFSGFKGQDLGVVIDKLGYEYKQKDSSFSYSYFEADHKRHKPDPKNPIVFTLWKKQGAETLIYYDKVWRFPVNEGPVKIDLIKGKIGQSEADLVVTISRIPLRMRYGQRGFAWSATVDVVGGGLVRAGRQDYYNQAPSSGYVPRFEYMQEAESIADAQAGRINWTWSESIADNFYITSRDGKNYARVALRIKPNSDHDEGDNEALVAAEVWLNPNGNRNLEFDPTKVVKP